MNEKPNFLSIYGFPISLAVFFIIILTPLMGRKNGYTVDANPSFQLTKEIVETGSLFPKTAVKQGYIYSIIYIPFYEMGSWIHAVLPIQDTDTDWMRRKCLCWMNTVITGLTVGLLSMLLRVYGFSSLTQLFLPLIYGFSTLAFCYARYDYNKSLAALLLLCSFYFYLQFLPQRQDRWLLYCGIVLGLLATLRLELSLIGVVYMAGVFFEKTPQKIKRLSLLAAPLLAGGLFVLFYNHLYWGGELAGGYKEDSPFTFFSGIAGFLFSPGKNIWVFNPVLLLLPLCIRLFYKLDPQRFFYWLAVWLIPFLFYSAWGNWWGGWGFGPRHLVPLLPLLVIPLAVILESKDAGMIKVLALLSIAGFGVQWLGSAFDFNDVIMTLQKVGISEPDLLWIPIWNAVLQHLLFLLNVPFQRWDFAVIAIGDRMPGVLFSLLLLFWFFCLAGIVYYWKRSLSNKPELNQK